MIDKKLIEQLKPEDIIICIRPTLKNDTEWTGDINLSVLAGRTNPLDDDDYYSLLHFTKMIAATVPIMEQSSDLRDIVSDYVYKEVDSKQDLIINLDLESESDRGKVLDRTDNVVTLSFGGKTEGNA